MRKKFLRLKRLKKGFTLIELVLVFSVIGIITAIGISSFGSYNNSQQFETGLAEFSNFLSITRSKAISQVKPSVCTGTLEGYRVAVTISGSNYEQDVLCGGSVFTLTRKKLPDQLTFMSGSIANISFDVSTGTVLSPGSIAITGFGKTKTVMVDKIGNISTNSGFVAGANPTATPTPDIACSKDYFYYPYPPGYCVLYAGSNAGQYCEASCGGQVSLPTGTAATSTPIPSQEVPAATSTPTPSPTPSASTTVVLSSSPNPSNYSQNVVFTVTVTGTNCTPLGQVRFFADGSASPFTAAALTTGTNPKTGTASYAYLASSATPHSIKATYFTASTCPNADSPTISHKVN